MNRISRRAFLKGAGGFSLLASTGALSGCGLLGEDEGAAGRLSDAKYSLLDPRRPERFTNPLSLPGRRRRRDDRRYASRRACRASG